MLWLNRRPTVYEHHRQSLLPRRKFYHRLARNIAISLILIVVALALGTAGYHLLCGLPGDDAFMNASMILTGMGPVNTLHGTTAKVFASFYAIACGVLFPTTIGIMLAPVLHRFLHKLHIDEDEARQRKG